MNKSWVILLSNQDVYLCYFKLFIVFIRNKSIDHIDFETPGMYFVRYIMWKSFLRLHSQETSYNTLIFSLRWHCMRAPYSLIEFCINDMFTQSVFICQYYFALHMYDHLSCNILYKKSNEVEKKWIDKHTLIYKMECEKSEWITIKNTCKTKHWINSM